MLRMDRASKADKSDPSRRYGLSQGSKVSRLWLGEIETKIFSRYTSRGECNIFHAKSTSCQASRRKSLEFINSYSYAFRSDVQKLKEKLSICRNTAYIDTETSIDNFLHIWNQDEHFPSMMKGNPFFQLSYDSTISDTW
jgi:hypothetical protein